MNTVIWARGRSTEPHVRRVHRWTTLNAHKHQTDTLAQPEHSDWFRLDSQIFFSLTHTPSLLSLSYRAPKGKKRPWWVLVSFLVLFKDDAVEKLLELSDRFHSTSLYGFCCLDLLIDHRYIYLGFSFDLGRKWITIATAGIGRQRAKLLILITSPYVN